MHGKCTPLKTLLFMIVSCPCLSHMMRYIHANQACSTYLRLSLSCMERPRRSPPRLPWPFPPQAEGHPSCLPPWAVRWRVSVAYWRAVICVPCAVCSVPRYLVKYRPRAAAPVRQQWWTAHADRPMINCYSLATVTANTHSLREGTRRLAVEATYVLRSCAARH